MKKVVLIYWRYFNKYEKEYDSLQEAYESAEGMEEREEASTDCIKVDGTVICTRPFVHYSCRDEEVSNWVEEHQD